jgi:carbamoyltransferase
MNSLGLNYMYHDSKACLVRNGKRVVALEEKRLTRQKHTGATPIQQSPAILRLPSYH